MKEGKRIAFWDNYKGVLILFVVFGHYIYSYASDANDEFVKNLYTFIYAFHMPAFVFCSGYFSKSVRSRSKESIIKIIMSYIIFNTMMMWFAYFYLGSKMTLLSPYYSYWYIISLVVWRIVIGELASVKLIIPLSLIITLLLGYWSEFNNMFSIRRTIAFFVFFALGYFCDKEKMETLIAKKNIKTYLAGVLLGIVFVIVVPFIIEKFSITSNMTMMQAYQSPEDIFKRLLLIAIACVAICILILIVPNRNIPFLSMVGRNSLFVYLGHRFMTIVFYELFFTAETYSSLYLLYAFIASVITCVALGNDFVSVRYNNFITNLAVAMNEKEGQKGVIIKTVLIIVFIICLLLRVVCNYF